MDASVAKKQVQTQAEARLKVSKALRREEGECGRTMDKRSNASAVAPRQGKCLAWTRVPFATFRLHQRPPPVTSAALVRTKRTSRTQCCCSFSLQSVTSRALAAAGFRLIMCTTAASLCSRLCGWVDCHGCLQMHL
jgi:hypothetical protein